MIAAVPGKKKVELRFEDFKITPVKQEALRLTASQFFIELIIKDNG
jgi:hypothetical protein